MDRICQGLWDLMRGRSAVINDKEVRAFDFLNQGVKMKVVASGEIKVGDDVTVVEYEEEI